jgi:hypothetical protein
VPRFCFLAVSASLRSPPLKPRAYWQDAALGMRPSEKKGKMHNRSFLGSSFFPCAKVLLQTLGHFAAAAVFLMLFVPLDSLLQRRFGGHSVILVPGSV